MRFTLYTSDTSTRFLLIYLYELNKSKIDHVDIVSAHNIVQSLYIDWEREYNINLYSIGAGEYKVMFQDQEMTLTVRKFIDDKHMLSTSESRTPEYVKEVVIDIVNESAELLMKEMTQHAKRYVEDKFADYTKENINIKKYIYLSDDGYWDLMNNTQMRQYNSVFLREGVKERIFDFVKEFVLEDTRKEYQKFDIPYKCNIMLYGKPGTGKTTTILAVASHLHLNIGLIPISRTLDDTKLIHAMNSIKKRNCRIIVLEDVDCLFMNRKENDTMKNSLTLSGLLNCLDGLFRNEGIIVFMTANNISAIDEAMLRSCRMDLRIYYDYADEYQTKQCFDFYFKDKGDQFEKLMGHIRYKNYTPAMLQQYFFKNRHEKDICKNIHELDDIIQFANEGVKELSEESPSKHLYM